MSAIQLHSDVYLNRQAAQQLVEANNKREREKATKILRYDPAQKVWYLAFVDKVTPVKKVRVKRVELQLCFSWWDEMNQTQN